MPPLATSITLFSLGFFINAYAICNPPAHANPLFVAAIIVGLELMIAGVVMLVRHKKNLAIHKRV